MAEKPDIYGEGRFDNFTANEEYANAKYSVMQNVLKELEELGISGRSRPKIVKDHLTIFKDMAVGTYYNGEVPDALRILSLEDLSALYSLVLHWYGYLRSQQAIYKGRKAEAKKKLAFTTAMLRKLYAKTSEGDKVPVQMATDMTYNDQRYVDADAALEFAATMHDLIDAQRTIAAHEFDMISREITIRQVQIESHARQRGFNSGSKHLSWKLEESEHRFEKIEREGQDDTDQDSPEPAAEPQQTAESRPPTGRRLRRDFRTQQH